ncbi:MAG: fibronectin type III-like domain-contianing protein, partial [Lutibacter sp.]
GLSYTKFKFSDLKLSASKIHGNQNLKVSFKVTNTGESDGAEVAQLYVQDIESSVIRPIKELKGFKKVFLKKGEETTIELILTKKDLSFYDANTKNWKAEDGQFNILIGNASDNILLKDKITYTQQ